MKKILILILLLTIFCCFYAFPYDFNLGSITGIVYDHQLKIIEGVQITIVGTENIAYTDSTGNFFFYEIEPGTYTLSFVMKGYQTQTTKITLQKGQSRYIEVEMVSSGLTLN